MTVTEQRSCKDCGVVFERWNDWSPGGSYNCQCRLCYLAYTQARQTPHPKCRRTAFHGVRLKPPTGE